MSMPAGRLWRKMLMDVVECAREMMSERTKDMMRACAEKGLWNGGRPPYSSVSQGSSC